MENTSKQDKAIGRRDRAYYRRRQQNRLFARIAKCFATEAAAGRISRKELAAKLGKDPAQISRWLAYPTNLEIDTISDLLLAMGAEMDYQVVRFADRAKQNYAHPLTIESVDISVPPIHKPKHPIQQEPETFSNSAARATVNAR